MTFKDRTDMLSRNVGKKLLFYAAYNPKRWAGIAQSV